MNRYSIILTTIFVALFALFGCGATTESNSVSFETIESSDSMRSIAPGVSEGEYAGQRVIYVSDQQGADWLIWNTSQEYNSLFERYAQTHDANLLDRMRVLQNTLQAASERVVGPFLMTYAPEAGLVATVSFPEVLARADAMVAAPAA